MTIWLLYKPLCPWVVCLCVCAIAEKTRFLMDGSHLVEDSIANNGKPLDIFLLFFVVLLILCILKHILVLGSLQASLLYIMGELAVGASVAVAVGVSEKWQVTDDVQHVTHDIWHVTHNIGHMTRYLWHVTPELWHIFFLLLTVCLCSFWYWCYYPHKSTYSFSPVCGIFWWPKLDHNTPRYYYRSMPFP